MSVGQPADILLNDFGNLIYEAFGDCPYHVGSSVKKKRGWRDVDVRLILSDERYAALGLGDPMNPHMNALWRALSLAFATLGQKMTGLPIDFQIQQQTEANKLFSPKDGHIRSALGLTPWRYTPAAKKANGGKP